MIGSIRPDYFYLSTQEADTGFGFSNSRAGIVILILVIAVAIFYAILKFYEKVKYKHWSERQNRIKAVRRVVNNCHKDIDELDREDLISHDLVTLYDYYGRCMDPLVDDLGKEFPALNRPANSQSQNTKD